MYAIHCFECGSLESDKGHGLWEVEEAASEDASNHEDKTGHETDVIGGMCPPTE